MLGPDHLISLGLQGPAAAAILFIKFSRLRE